MDDTRFIEEQIRTYYFVAKTMISEANLGIFGMVSSLEKILDSVYVCDDIQQMDKLIFNFDINFNKNIKRIDELNYSKESVREVVDRGLASSGSLYNKQELQGLLNKSLVALPSTGRMISHCFYRMVSLRKRNMDIKTKEVQDEKIVESKEVKQEVVSQDFGTDILEEKRKEKRKEKKIKKLLEKKEKKTLKEEAKEDVSDVEVLDLDEEYDDPIEIAAREREMKYDEAIARMFDELETCKASGGNVDEVFEKFNQRLDEIDMKN